MTETSLARVRSADGAARTALVELEGSEGAAVSARLADHVHPQTLVSGAECVVASKAGGERTLIAVLGHNPAEAAICAPSAVSSGSPPSSFAYTDGTTWQDALTASLRTLGSCNLWAQGWLALSASSQSAAAVWDLRLSVDGAGAGPAIGWGSALANLRQVCALSASVAVPGGGLWTVRLQVRVKASGVTATCTGGQLLADARVV